MNTVTIDRILFGILITAFSLISLNVGIKSNIITGIYIGIICTVGVIICLVGRHLARENKSQSNTNVKRNKN